MRLRYGVGHRLSAVAALGAACGLLSGCLAPVPVPEVHPTGAAGEQCAQVMAALPDEVLEQPSREVESAEFTAAWGDPAIHLRCGVGKPERLGPASDCYEVNHVGWFAEEGEGGMLFTTIGRPVFIEVGVPSAYAPEANALVDLADAVSVLPAEHSCV